MPTQDYHNVAGQRIPGNTTIISGNCGWGKQGLMYWAWQQGKDGKDFRQSREDAADAGTLCHSMIEADIKGKALPGIVGPTDRAIWDKAETGYLNYLEWKKGIRLELITMEAPVVSELYQYGTTLDIIARANGKTCIVEVKTSNAIHEEYLIQIAAQRQAWNENHPDNLIQGTHLLKVNKETAAFAHLYWGELPGCFDAFLDLRDLYDRKKQLKALL